MPVPVICNTVKDNITNIWFCIGEFIGGIELMAVVLMVGISLFIFHQRLPKEIALLAVIMISLSLAFGTGSRIMLVLGIFSVVIMLAAIAMNYWDSIKSSR